MAGDISTFYADRRAFSGPVLVQCGFDAALACGIDVEGISSVENFFQRKSPRFISKKQSNTFHKIQSYVLETCPLAKKKIQSESASNTSSDCSSTPSEMTLEAAGDSSVENMKVD